MSSVEVFSETRLVRRRGRPRSAEARSFALRQADRLGEVAGLLGHEAGSMDSARSSLNLLGDAGRRTVFELLARSPQRVSPNLTAATAMASPDVMHRLRSLVQIGAAVRQPAHAYRLDPTAAKNLATYFDVLATAQAGGGGRVGRRL